MWQWFHANSSVLSMFISLGTLGVWLFYAHLLLAGFRRQRRARILINQCWGRQVDSVCLVSNMSQESIYIHSILLTVSTHDDEYTESVTDFNTAELSDSETLSQKITRQGPLGDGEQINLGSFRSLIRKTAKGQKNLAPEEESLIRQLEIDDFRITVIASYGPEGGLVGAQRKFRIQGEDNENVGPLTTTTDRLARHQARRQLGQWLESEL